MRAIDKRQFSYRPLSGGCYEVQYFTDSTVWTNKTTDMSMIDAVKNEDEPTQEDMIYLRDLCKRGKQRRRL